MSPWRQKSRAVILAALKDADAQGLEGKARERFVSDRYPFGERAMHPYKIWLSEFRLLVKEKARPEKVEWPWPDGVPLPRKPIPGQLGLFDEAG